MIRPPPTAANRRSLATRIAVTRGTASLSGAGFAALCTADAVRTAPGTGTTGAIGKDVPAGTPVAGLSAAGACEFRAGGLDLTAGRGVFTGGGFDFGADDGALAAPFDSGFFAGSLRAGALAPLPTV